MGAQSAKPGAGAGAGCCMYGGGLTSSLLGTGMGEERIGQV